MSEITLEQAVAAINDNLRALTEKRDVHKAMAKDITKQINELRQQVNLQTGAKRGRKPKKKEADATEAEQAESQPQASAPDAEDAELGSIRYEKAPDAQYELNYSPAE